MPVSRREFLRGRLRAPIEEIRPPWALAPDAFEDRCSRCGACLDICPQGILKAGDGGYPMVDFGAGACSFCGDCVRVCEPRALRAENGDAPWRMRVSISDRCLPHRGVECRVCGECCEVAAIRFRPRIGGVSIPETDLASCTGCGACVAPCPVGAISMEVPQ